MHHRGIDLLRVLQAASIDFIKFVLSFQSASMLFFDKLLTFDHLTIQGESSVGTDLNIPRFYPDWDVKIYM